MALIDWGIAVVLVISVLSAAKKGFFLEIFSLAGAIAGLLLASWNYQRAVPWVSRWIHSIPAAEIIAFVGIALGVMIVAGLAGRVVRWAVRSVGLGWLDRLAGAAFGLLKGCVVVTIAVLALAAFAPRADWFKESRMAPYFLSMAHQTVVVTPSGFAERVRRGIEVIRKAQPEWALPAA